MLRGRIRETRLYKHIRALTHRYEKFWIPAMLLGGLASDVIQYSALDLREKFIILAAYVVVAFGALLLMSYPRAAEVKILRSLLLVAPFAHQFAVGGLLAASLLFYWFGGSFSVSWPILLIVALCMAANEFLRTHFLRPTTQVAVFTFALFSLVTILFSFVFNSLSPLLFVAGGIATVVVMAAYLVVLIRVGNLQTSRYAMWLAVLGIFALMNVGYFLNVIPPIPLSLRDAGIYADIARVNGDYVLTGQEESWIDRILPGQTLTVTANQPLYAFTAIFAPGALSTKIVHKWQHYDATIKRWVTDDALSFSIVGGRDEGYRGYSRKSHVDEGKWRVSVETPRGQVLGRIGFRVVHSK